MTSPTPLWVPPADAMSATAMGRFLARVQTREPEVTNYATLHRWSVQHYQDFWRLWLQTSGIVYEGDTTRAVRRHEMPFAEFFPDVRLSFAENLLQRRDNGNALVSIAEGRATQRLSYGQLHREVTRVRNGLKALGVQVGDRVAAIMPNIAETVIAMLATTSLGAVWSSCSPDFGVQGAVDRFGQIKPKVLLAPNAYGYHGKMFDCTDKVAQIRAAIPSVEHVVMVPVTHPTLPKGVLPWADLGLGHDEPLSFVRMPFNAPLFVLYSSGTTGIPKCIVHGVGGTLLQLSKELMLHCDLRRDDNLMYFTTCGWMMWNWQVAALMTGGTLTLFDGSPTHPSPARLWETVQQEGVSHFGTSAKFIGSGRGTMHPRRDFKLDKLRMVLSTGSPLLPEDFDWFYEHVGQVPLCSICGGTDIISCFMLGNPIVPVYRGEIQTFGLGMDGIALDEHNQPVLGSRGELACRTPFVSMPVSFWDDAEGAKYRKAYFERLPGTWVHGDTICITESQGPCGGIVVYGRSDATLKPGGVRIGTAEIYRLVETLPQVEDSVVIGQPWQGDVRVVLFVKLAAGTSWSAELETQIKASIRAGATPRHVPGVLLPVEKIPYTKSGKKMELAVLDVVCGREPKNLEAMQDASALACYRDLERLRA